MHRQRHRAHRAPSIRKKPGPAAVFGRCLIPGCCIPWLCPMNYLFPAQHFYSSIQTRCGSGVWGERMLADGKRKRKKKKKNQ